MFINEEKTMSESIEEMFGIAKDAGPFIRDKTIREL